MKTSKRLLSILLMLTMLLSMFTVMAFAEGKVPYKECTATHDFDHPANGDISFEAVEANCVDKGTPQYYQCKQCGGYYWKGVGGEKGARSYCPRDLDYFKTDPTKHKDLESVTAKEPTCTDVGYKAHSYCSGCKKYYDESGNDTTFCNVVIKATGHSMEHHEKKDSTCTEEGNVAYYRCTKCHKNFKNEDGTNQLSDITIAKKAHTLTAHVEKAPTCTETGTKAYWTCAVCNQMFSDEACTTKIDAPETIDALDHDLGDWVVNKDGTEKTRSCKREGCDYKETVKIVKTYEVTVKTNSLVRGWVNYIHDGTVTEKITSLTAPEGQEIKLNAVVEDDDYYEFSYWEVSGIKLTNAQKKDATLTFKMPAKAVTIKAVFGLKKTTGDYHWLTLDIGSHGSVEFKDDGTWRDVEDYEDLWLKKGVTYKFRADPDSGYKTVWQLDDGSKYTGNTFSFEMGRYNSVLHVYFVSKSSTVEDDYPTLTFDITGKHGTVYRGTREYEDGDVISIKKNDKMTFKADVDKGYVAVWTYKGDTYVGDEYTVKMGATDAKLYVEFMDKDDIRLTELPFRDVSKRDWYYDDVVYVYRKGYMDGMSSTRFGGELNTTRGQIVTILWRLTGEPRATKRNPFTDVSSSQYYYDAISWAYDAGVVDGFDAHTFKPDQNVTREQLAAILYRYAEYMNLSTSGSAYLSKYRDADKIANWAYDAMAWANYRGLINGTSATRIDPKGYATRAQIAAILHRFAVEYGA